MEHQDPLDVLQSIVDRHASVFAILHEAVLLGWRAAMLDMESLPRRPGPLRLRTRRNIENDYAVTFARQLLEPLEASRAIEWVDESETLTLRLEPRYAVRLKKTDRSGRPSNIATGRQDRIKTAGQLLLFGIIEDDLLIGEELWLTVAYVPDALDEELLVVGLVAGDGSLGMLPLERADDTTLASLAPDCWQLIEEARRKCG